MQHGKQYGTEIIYILNWTHDLVGYSTAHTNIYKQYKYNQHIRINNNPFKLCYRLYG